MLLTFSRFDEHCRKTERVHINPDEVESVYETERRPMGAFFQPVAIIKTNTGDTHVVYDYNRDVATKIIENQTKRLMFFDETLDMNDELIEKLRQVLQQPKGVSSGNKPDPVDRGRRN